MPAGLFLVSLVLTGASMRHLKHDATLADTKSRVNDNLYIDGIALRIMIEVR